ncbi:MAG: hypothetical protein LUH11_01055, partial [Candidatus Gastranaerophilales bacterium]|nr:hypothetical protein [Candidatus Gastranaerophilales bacterium]
VQVLNAENDSIYIALSEDLVNKYSSERTWTDIWSDDIKAVVNWDEEFDYHSQDVTETTELKVSTTNTENDSIELSTTETRGDEVLQPEGDTLALLNRYKTEEDREFNFDASDNKYEVSTDLGTTSAGTLSINGVAQGVERSTIDFNSKSGFDLSNETTLNITNTKIENAITAITSNNTSAETNILNSVFEGNENAITNIIGTVNIKNSLYTNNTGTAIINNGELNITNTNFTNNSGNINGGAIYTTKDLNLISDDYNMVISGNYTDSAGNIDDNAIYLADSDASLNFDLKNNGTVLLNDNIRGEDGYSVNITGDSVDNTTFYLFNDMYNANLNIGNTTLNTVNDNIHVYDLNSFTLTDNINMIADVDLEKEEMDRITADTYGEHQGTLTVSGWNLLSDTTKDSAEVYFAEEGLKDYVSNGQNNELPTSYQTTAYTPVYKYNVAYDNRDDAGYFVFSKNSTSNPSNSFNPSVLTSSVASQTGAYTAMTTAFDYAFEHSDYYMKLSNTERFALKEANKYAINDVPLTSRAIMNNYNTNEGMWFKPYTNIDSINLKNGPKVDAINYGAIAGGDSRYKELKNGWGTVFTGYAGYNGSSQSYSGIHTYQNGGLLGATQTFYKDNFYTALTASAGASVGESSTMYGDEDFTMLMAGVASKTGYNLEFKEGGYIIQPSLLLSYTYINTFDYNNAAGVRIDSDPLHAIQINPGIRFVRNLRNGWQPYANVSMVWNILDKTKVTANEVTLPQMSIKPYVEYGVGVQKRWKDRFIGYGQVMCRNGGRTGVAFTAGFRWSLGKEEKPIENVNVPNDGTISTNTTRKIIKQLTPEQKAALYNKQNMISTNYPNNM